MIENVFFKHKYSSISAVIEIIEKGQRDLKMFVSEKEGMKVYTNEESFHLEKLLHKTFGIKENRTYFERKGAYIIPIKGDAVGVVETPKGYFLIGGGMNTGETASQCIARECIEETGYQVEIMEQICSAEMYYEHPTIGFFHPMQFYYSGELLKLVQKPTEADHVFRWISYERVQNQMYLEMHSWAIKQVWERRM